MAEVTRRWYTEAFKREAACHMAQVARDLWIPDNVLSCWRLEHLQTGGPRHHSGRPARRIRGTRAG